MGVTTFLLPIAAAFCGGFLGFYLKGRITKNVKVLLAFSGAYLFALTVLHLLPEVFELIGEASGYFILVGFLLQLTMDYFSKGLEHGHIHLNDLLSKTFPLGIFISLFLHSMLEGLPLNTESFPHTHDHAGTLGPALLWGIAIHKVPEALALTALLYHFFQNKAKVFLYIAIYAMATPIGLLLGNFLLMSSFAHPEIVYARILAMAIGIFIHVSTTIIFEADEHHKLSWKKIVAILCGLAIVLFTQ